MKGRNITCDVAVVGGGSAGIAAAIGAHDAGAKTILIERSPYFGVRQRTLRFTLTAVSARTARTGSRS